MISFDYVCSQPFLAAKMVLKFKITGLVYITQYVSFSTNPLPKLQLDVL